MLPFRLFRIALEAEALRLSHLVRRMVFRVLFACIATVLLLGALAFGHVAAWCWLRQTLAAQYVALIFVGVDLLLAAVLIVLATRTGPGAVEAEALAVRRRALSDVAGSLTFSAVLMRLAEQWFMPHRKD